ncbi:MAG: ISL3 family transposase [Lewinellaceae bacterium]|nr:ISL3 family transposase [Lewinellaceae bacterium]MCB9282929.1 ISL3 family transposase [Lewinellaceae bacterium]
MTSIPLELLPESVPIQLDGIAQEEDSFVLEIQSTIHTGYCPVCKTPSTRVHSNYTRSISDLPWAGYCVKIHWKVRKFYCMNEGCARKIFSERLGKTVAAYGRRTNRMDRHLNEIGIALGGNAGAALSRFLGLPVSASTMLRLLYRLPEPTFSTPRVLGIDDWAFRKGHNYGTILVDLEKRCPIDLLSDRESETVKNWLNAHPGIEIISRDRATGYAQAAREGAPEALQVADRWHLLKNLGDALKRMLDSNNTELRQAAKDIAEAEMAEKPQPVGKTEVQPEGKKSDTPKVGSEDKQPKYEALFQEVKKLQRQGASKKSVMRQLGLHGQTVRRYWKYEEYPGKAPTSSALRFENYLRKRWNEGENSRKKLWHEIKEQGFNGSLASVYRLTDKLFHTSRQRQSAPTLAVKLWPTKKVCPLLAKNWEDLTSEEQIFLKAFFKRCPKARKARKLARQFKSMTDNLQPTKLDPWLESVMASGINALKQFAVGITQDYDAVKAAITVKWSNGQVEGQVNRLKTIKRQMYGRASFELLRKRVLMDSS